jgi:hypothetical protein
MLSLQATPAKESAGEAQLADPTISENALPPNRPTQEGDDDGCTRCGETA